MDRIIARNSSPESWRQSLVNAAIWSALPALTLLCVAAHIGRVLSFAFTPAALIVGIYFLRKSPASYIRFVVVLWMFSPLVRRLADWASSYTDPSPVLLAPLALTGLSGFLLLRRDVLSARYIAFLTAALGIAYGVTIGLLVVRDTPVLTETLRWTVPLVFGLFCARQDSKPELIATLLSTMMWSGVLAAAYGLVQYAIVPPWDGSWLAAAIADGKGQSFGPPVPFGIRVFSTMSNPGILAMVLSVSIVIAFRAKKLWTYPVVLLCGATLLLTMIRTMWASTALMLVILIFRLPLRERMLLVLRATIAGAIISLLMLPMMATELGDKVSERMSTFQSIDKDESYLARTAGNHRALSVIASEPFGMGIGWLESKQFSKTAFASVDRVGPHDIGALEMFLELGYLGVALYAIGMGILAVRMLNEIRTGAGNDLTIAVLGIGVLTHFVSTNPMISFEGILFWTVGGLLVSSTNPVREGISRAKVLPALSDASLPHGAY